MLKTDMYMLWRDSVVLSLALAFCCSEVKPDESWFHETLFAVQRKIFETNRTVHLDCIVASQILSNHWNWSQSICISGRARRTSLSFFWPIILLFLFQLIFYCFASSFFNKRTERIIRTIKTKNKKGCGFYSMEMAFLLSTAFAFSSFSCWWIRNFTSPWINAVMKILHSIIWFNCPYKTATSNELAEGNQTNKQTIRYIEIWFFIFVAVVVVFADACVVLSDTMYK